MKKMKIFAYFLLVLVFLLFPAAAFAIPSLGVAPAKSNMGLYYGTMQDGSDTNAGVEWLDDYQQYFVQGSVSIPANWNDGFSMPASGQDLTVWWGMNDGFDNEDPRYEWGVWLLTNAAAGDGFSFGGAGFDPIYSDSKIDGYQTEKVTVTESVTIPNPAGGPPIETSTEREVYQYYGVNLGSIESNTSWTSAPEDSPFYDGDKKEFYFNTAQILYSDFNYAASDEDGIPDDWLFAISGNVIGELAGVPFVYSAPIFSPKTTSAGHNPVPEPATMLLLGSGLIGLAGFRRRFRKS